MFKEGDAKPPTSGRKKGSLNKFTTLKQAFLDTFQDLGGTDGMTKAFKRTDFTKRDFYKLISKMLPASIDMKVDAPPIYIVPKKAVPKKKPVKETAK